jgi:hypothetical protein
MGRLSENRNGIRGLAQCPQLRRERNTWVEGGLVVREMRAPGSSSTASCAGREGSDGSCAAALRAEKTADAAAAAAPTCIRIERRVSRLIGGPADFDLCRQFWNCGCHNEPKRVGCCSLRGRRCPASMDEA